MIAYYEFELATNIIFDLCIFILATSNYYIIFSSILIDYVVHLCRYLLLFFEFLTLDCTYFPIFVIMFVIFFSNFVIQNFYCIVSIFQYLFFQSLILKTLLLNFNLILYHSLKDFFMCCLSHNSKILIYL